MLSVVSEEECNDNSNLVDVPKPVTINETPSQSRKRGVTNRQRKPRINVRPRQDLPGAANFHEFPLLHVPQSKNVDQGVLINMRDLCGIVTDVVQAHHGAEFPLFKLRSVYDGLDSVSHHLRHNRHLQALEAYEQVQDVYSRMFTTSDPWILTTVIHCLFDYVSEERASPTIVSFLHYMSQLAWDISKRHPIASLLRTFLSGHHCSPGMINALFQVCLDVLESALGRSYTVNFCINRIRAYALDHFGLLDEAERVLSKDLAYVADIHGVVSTRNLSRLLSLAGCLYQKGDYFGAIVQIDEFWGSVHNKKIPDDRLLSIACFGGLADEDRLDVARDAAICIKAWLLQFKALAQHVNHAEEIVAWLERGAPMCG